MPPSLPPQAAQQLSDISRVMTGLALALQHTASYEARVLSHGVTTLYHQNQHALPSLSQHAGGVQRQAESLFREGRRVVDSLGGTQSSASSSSSSPSSFSVWSPYPSSQSSSSSSRSSSSSNSATSSQSSSSSSSSSFPTFPTSSSDVMSGLSTAMGALSSAVSALPTVGPLLSSLPLQNVALSMASSVLPPGLPRLSPEQLQAGVQSAVNVAQGAAQSFMTQVNGMQQPQSNREQQQQQRSQTEHSPYPDGSSWSSSSTSSSSSSSSSFSSSPSSSSPLQGTGLFDLSSLSPPLPNLSALPSAVAKAGEAAQYLASEALGQVQSAVGAFSSQSPFGAQQPTEPSQSPSSSSSTSTSSQSSFVPPSPYPEPSSSSSSASASAPQARTREQRERPPTASSPPTKVPFPANAARPVEAPRTNPSAPSSSSSTRSGSSSRASTSPSFPSPASAMSAFNTAAESAAAAASSTLQKTSDSFQKTAQSFLPPLPKFSPRERAVPSTPLGRIMGFGGIAMRMVTGSLVDSAKNLLNGSPKDADSNGAGAGIKQGDQPVDSPTVASTMTPTAEHGLKSDAPLHPTGSTGTSTSASSTAPDTASTSSSSSSAPSGLSRFMSAANTERLAEGLCRMRGAALKVGQMLSIQDDSLLPPQLQQVLNRVRDSADVMPRAQLERTLTAELGEGWETRMRSFDWSPIAAASIGQVHRGVDGEGREVVMKVQYPGVADSIGSDVNNVRTLIRLFNVLPAGLYIDQTMQAAKEELSVECDYENEAESQMQFKQLIESSPLHPRVHVPAVIPSLSTSRVLTTEYVRGVPIDWVAREGRDALSQEARNELCQRLLQLCLLEVFDFRFMQTDPNWSNFLYDPQSGVLHCIDFGASRQYDKAFVDEYMRMVHACAERDRQGVLDASTNLGFLTGDESRAMLDAHVEAAFIVGEPFSRQFADGYDFAHMDMGKRVSELARIMVKLRLAPPPKDSYTLHRKLSGCFLTCKKLEVNIPCRQLFMDVYSRYDFSPESDAERE